MSTEGSKLVYHEGYTMVIFGCGRQYAGRDGEVGPSIARHRQSGCKGCRRYARRMAAIDRKNGFAHKKFVMGSS